MKKLESITGFYYIGTDRENISKLVNIYKRGYASSNFQEAMKALKSDTPIQPEVICCESGIGFDAIKKLSTLLSENPELSKIPFLIDANNLVARENDQFIRNKTVDDMLNIRDWDEKNLHSTICYLQKNKSRGTQIKSIRKEIIQGPEIVFPFLKKCFDIFLAVSVLILLSPVFIFIALLLRVESKGSIFNCSKRIGLRNRIFTFYKFRTMISGADQRRAAFSNLNLYMNSRKTTFFNVGHNQRLTRIGSFLQKTGLDELPQLVNVLLGDITLLGSGKQMHN